MATVTKAPRRAARAAAAILGVALLLAGGTMAARAETVMSGTAANDPFRITPGLDGAAWNQHAVNGIGASVRAGTPVFPHRTCTVADPRYASLVWQVTDGQGSSVQSVVWY